MGLSVLISVSLLSMIFSLWIRRITWTCTGETAATLNIALQIAAVFLMSPFASHTVGRWLHSLTGLWNLEDYLGHDCYVVAASAIVYNALERLQEGVTLQRSFKLMVELPATICIPGLFALFSMSRGSAEPIADFFDMKTDGWLSGYWVGLCVILIYLLSFGIKKFLVLRTDERSARIANIYMGAAVCGILAAGTRLVTSLIPQWQEVFETDIVWVFACACGAIFALTSAWSWMQKVKAFQRPLEPV